MELYKKYGDGMVYVVLTAISFVFIDDLGDYINPFISLLCMAIIATVWFNLVNLKCLTNIYRLCIKNYKIYLMVTLLISINWLASITAPHYSDPFIYLSVYFMVLAICGFIARYFETKLNNNLLSSANQINVAVRLW